MGSIMSLAFRARILLGSSEACPALPPTPPSCNERCSSISFPFIHFRTLFRNGALPTPFPSIVCALFPVQRRVGVSALLLSSSLPYILPKRLSDEDSRPERAQRSKDLSTRRQIIFINGHTTRQVYCLVLTPLFATLTKTAGVSTNSSHSGTAPSTYLGSPHPGIP
jgi:hypothetical protein